MGGVDTDRVLAALVLLAWLGTELAFEAQEGPEGGEKCPQRRRVGGVISIPITLGVGRADLLFFSGAGGPFCSTEEVVRKGRKDTDPSSPGLREIA